jgi:hypothetical protein
MPLPGTALTQSTLREVAAQFYVNPDWILSKNIRTRRVVAARREVVIRAHQRGVRTYVLAEVLNVCRQTIRRHLHPELRVRESDKTKAWRWKNGGLSRTEFFLRKKALREGLT